MVSLPVPVSFSNCLCSTADFGISEEIQGLVTEGNDPSIIFQKALVTRTYHDRESGSEKTGNFYEMVDKRTGFRYREVSSLGIEGNLERNRGKEALLLQARCFGVALVNPTLYAPLAVAWYVLKLAVNVAYIAFCVLNNLCQSEGIKELENVVDDLPTCFKNNIWGIVRVPFYTIAIELATLVGVFVPFEGRVLVAKAENRFHSGVSYKNDYRYAHEMEGGALKFVIDALFDQREAAFYIGWCFQPLGNITDSNVQNVKYIIGTRV